MVDEKKVIKPEKEQPKVAVKKKAKQPEKPAKPDEFKELYKKLSKPMEDQYIIEYEEDGKKLRGYNAIGAVNRLNEVVGIQNWMAKYTIRKEELYSGAWAVSLSCTLKISWNGITLIRQGAGGAYARKIENAYKGAYTSAFKNACKYYGVGNELYMDNGMDEEITYEAIEKEEVKDKPEDITKLEDKIKQAKTIEQLQSLEDKVKEVEEKYRTIIYKIYNNQKIKLMSK